MLREGSLRGSPFLFPNSPRQRTALAESIILARRISFVLAPHHQDENGDQAEDEKGDGDVVRFGHHNGPAVTASPLSTQFTPFEPTHYSRNATPITRSTQRSYLCQRHQTPTTIRITNAQAATISSAVTSNRHVTNARATVEPQSFPRNQTVIFPIPPSVLWSIFGSPTFDKCGLTESRRIRVFDRDQVRRPALAISRASRV